MNQITITWQYEDEAYIVRQDEEYIGDFESLVDAGSFALGVAEFSGQDVILLAVYE
jgi:hypothetical protein